MSGSIFIPDVIEENVNGVFASNAKRPTLPVVVAPTQESRIGAHNVIRQELIVVGCVSLVQYNFDFDSSFIRADAKDGFAAFARVRQKHDGCPMTIFGHADPTGRGSDKARLHYNHALSERRARAVFGVLTRDAKAWEHLIDTQEGALGDVWGPKVTAAMRGAVGAGAATLSRRKLIEAYMDFLRGPSFPTLTADDFLGRGKQKATLQGCSAFNPQLLMSAIDQRKFDKATDKDIALKQERDDSNEPNRRVLIFLFAKGTVIDPTLWPCPDSVNTEAPCFERQWSNGEARRTTHFENHRRRYGREVPVAGRLLDPPNQALADDMAQKETTFGCRFYHGIALHSPCERDIQLWAIELLVDAPPPPNPTAGGPPLGKVPLANRRFVAIMGSTADAPVTRGVTTETGKVVLPIFDPNVRITLKIDAFDALVPPKAVPVNPSTPPGTPPAAAAETTDSDRFADEDSFVVLTLQAGDLEPIKPRAADSFGFDPDFEQPEGPLSDATIELAAMQRLYNLGFGSGDTGGPQFSKWSAELRSRFLKAFQKASGIPQTGKPDQATVDALFAAHGS